MTTTYALESGGKVRITFAEADVRLLRAPTLGEYRALRIGWRDMTDALPATNDNDRSDALEAGTVGWWRTVANALADTPFPDDSDSWPPWIVRVDIVNKVFAHWRADPLASGPTTT